jgi:hypothetical protein
VITENPFAKDLGSLSAESAADFFNQLGQTTEVKKETKPAKIEEKPQEPQQQEVHITETISKNVNWSVGPEKMIKRNLLIGNL